MTFKHGNFEYEQMLKERAIWIKSSLHTNFKIKIRSNKLLEDLKCSLRGKKLASKIYLEGLDRFVYCAFKYEFLPFI